jgi:hypothetical protein
MSEKLENTSWRVAFLHPDLGLGGAERLVVDAALELVSRGHTVDIYTAYHDPQRCFEETRGGKGGFGVNVAGDWWPRHIAGRFLALCAYIRCILVALYIAWLSVSGKVSSRQRACLHVNSFSFFSNHPHPRTQYIHRHTKKTIHIHNHTQSRTYALTITRMHTIKHTETHVHIHSCLQA